jgi:hypothetical protein
MLDFGQSYTGNDRAELYTRMILPPVFAKSLLETLRSSIEHYEKQFCDIEEVSKRYSSRKK